MDAMVTVDEKKAHVVCVPLPSQSHVKCMLKLARLLHHKGIQITFVNTQSNHNRLFKSADPDNVVGFQFKTVPDGLPCDTEEQPRRATHRYLATNFLDSFLDLVAVLETPVTCIISDGLMNFTKTPYAAERLGVPIILCWTLAACGFMACYQAKVLVEKGLVPLKDSKGYLDMVIDWIPGMEGIRLRDLPPCFLATKHDDPQLIVYVEAAKMADKVAEKSNFDGYSLRKEESECVRWLDIKESNSVVYVSFGSEREICLQELVEFGWGLVNSNHYFLWIIRVDLVDGKRAVFPQELEEAIKSRGFIASWCSQEEVLNHSSVGGFLAHGGWGSIIESLSAGVPMVCWPGPHDQRVNCIQMCKEWEVGMEMGNIVKRDEVEKLIRELMTGVEGERMRKKAMEWKKMAEIASGPNGSSSLDVEKLANEIIMLSRN
ncbi:hypothetical protein L1987_53675 [Smallanthus sonchifolius]|uniref:Uncharacterized protein n=1 Tax=Smallanthus sonchifolius TaxID=185202 RepID=A0ACB9EWK7_9ASTR|nr:hypothetical protein L1987_53675 [Smallanthus sonchifolius]